jgi:hypothetical protein
MNQPLEWAELWTAMDASPEWVPTTETMYYEMLEAVPPAAMGGGAFLVGEAHHHNGDGQPVYAMFRRTGGQFFAKYATVSEFNGGPA